MTGDNVGDDAFSTVQQYNVAGRYLAITLRPYYVHCARRPPGSGRLEENMGICEVGSRDRTDLELVLWLQLLDLEQA